MTTAFDHLPTLERALAARDWPAMSDWWKDTFAGFYGAARRAGRALRQLVLRVGRRGGKSSSLCRIAVLEALFGGHVVAPGDIGVVAIISVNRDEAAGRLRTIKAILDALGVKWRPIDGGIELADRPIAFKIYTASIAGVSGFTCICAICDEVAKWRDVDTGSNPASEVLRSLRPTLAGQPLARIFLSSSPMGLRDAHATAFSEGDTDFQLVASAETWVARPTLSEAECRELEPDEDAFKREYGCIPFDGSTSSLFGEGPLLAVTRRGGPLMLPRVHGVTVFAAEDAGARANAHTVMAGYARQVADDMTSVVIVGAREWRAPRGGALDTDATYREIADWLGEWGVNEIYTDQWSYDARRAVAVRHGLTLHLEAATQSSNVARAEAFRRRVADRLVELPDMPELRADLCGVRKWISKNGSFSIELEKVGGRHCDFAPALFMLADKAFAEEDGMPQWARPGMVRRMGEAIQAWGGSPFSPNCLGPRATQPFPDDQPARGGRLSHRVAANGEHELTGSAHDWPARFMCVFLPGKPARHGRETRQWGHEVESQWIRLVDDWRRVRGL